MKKINFDLRIGGQPISLIIEGDDDFLNGIYFSGAAMRGSSLQSGGENNKNISAAVEFLNLYSSGGLAKIPSAVELSPYKGITSVNIFYEKEMIALRLNLSGCSEKTSAVYRTLLNVPAGMSVSYGLLSENAGLPGAARFVGSAMASNNFPFIIPCHRVVRSDGSFGQYGGGDHLKPLLLNHESNFYG